jgi:hypothetical protein
MLIDMVSKVLFEIYHVVEGIVEYGLNDIILQGFRCLKDKIGKQREPTFQSVYHWLEYGFLINSYTMIFMVHVVKNQANHGVWWELLSI